MSKPFQSHRPSVVAKANNAGAGAFSGPGGVTRGGGRVVQRSSLMIGADTKASALKKREGISMEQLKEADQDAVEAKVADDDKSESTVEIERVGRSGFVDVEYSTLVPPVGLKHRGVNNAVSPTVRNLYEASTTSSFSLASPLDGEAVAAIEHKPQSKAEEDTLASRLMGLPGGLSMTSETASKYFGASARAAFSQRVSYLQKHRDVSAVITEEEDIYNLHFDRDASSMALPTQVPFGVDRSNMLQDPGEDEASVGMGFGLGGGASNGSSGSPSSRPSFYARFKAKVRGDPLAMNDDVMLRQSAFRSGVDDLDPNCPVDAFELGADHISAGVLDGGDDDASLASGSQFGGRNLRTKFSGAKAAAGNALAEGLSLATPMGSLVLGGEESLYASQVASSAASIQSMGSTHISSLAVPGGVKVVLRPPKINTATMRQGNGDDDDDVSTLADEGSQRSDDTLSVMSTLSLRKHLLEEGKDATMPASPRSTYINACLREGVNPRASLVLRKGLSKKLELQSYGMGDDNARLLSTAISSLPFLQSINLANNRLTDDGLYPLILAACYIPGLLELDLSQNKVDDLASGALKEYLRRPDCPLERLVLNQADVDDFECAEFIEAVMENRSLLELELSHNMLGGAENLNTVMPDLTTGAEALAEMIRSPNIKLRVLKLDWNMLRLDGGVELCESIAFNNTLTDLDLSYNSLGSAGGVALGQALIKNKALRIVRLANNNIDASACFTICAGVIENRGLELCNIDGNPICEQGAAALMMVPLIAGNRVSISAARCNVIMRDPSCWFSFHQPIGDYTLDMTDGFERAVCLMLLHAIAAHHSFMFETFEWIPAPGKKPAHIALKQVLIDEKVKYFDHEQKEVLATLERVVESASNIRLAVKLFNDVDEDGSGEVERGEFGDLIKSMGIDMSEMRIDEIFASYDMDQGGSIGITEFLNFLKVQKIEAMNRIQDMCFMPIMVADLGEGKPVDKTPYSPPTTGELHVVVTDGFVTKDIKRVLSNKDRQNLAHVANQAGGNDANSLLQVGIQGGKLRLEEGIKLVAAMSKDTGDVVKALFDILPQMASHEDAKRLIFQTGSSDKNTLVKLKRAAGSALRPIMGAYNGHYRLDLSSVLDRLCFARLLEVSATQKQQRLRRTVFPGTSVYDLSQKRNYFCFRNEHYKNKPMEINEAFASSVLPKGILEFDFSCALRPSRDDNPLPDFRFVKMCVNTGMLDPEECLHALNRLALFRRWSNKGLECDGHNMFQPDLAFATAMGEHMDEFYSNLQHRTQQTNEARQKEARVKFEASTGRAMDDVEDDISGRKISRTSPMDSNNPEETLENNAKYQIKLQRHMLAALNMRAPDDPGGAKGSKAPKGKSKVAPTSWTIRRQFDEYWQEVTVREGDEDDEGEGSGSDSGSEGGSSAGEGGSKAQEGGDDDASAGSAADASAGKGEGEDGNDNDSNTGSNDDGESSEEEDGNEVENLKAFMAVKIAVRQAAAALEAANAMSAISAMRMPGLRGASARASAAVAEQLDAATAAADAAAAASSGEPAGDAAAATAAAATADENKDKDESEAAVGLAIEDSGESALIRLQTLLLNPRLHISAKAKRVVETVDDFFSRVWMWARQLSLLMHCLRGLGQKKATRHFGTYRVELFVVLVCRVVDLHNIECVLRVLTPYEAACIYARLGWLHLWNPCKPEGCWEMDLTRPEERVVAKCLCELSTREPGENFVNQLFKWERKAEGMPGWCLTAPWLTEEGLPCRGIMALEYYSGECKKLKGCRPLVAFRKSLLHLFLIDEDELCEEGFRDRPAPAKEGTPVMLQDQPRWLAYLGVRQDLTRTR